MIKLEDRPELYAHARQAHALGLLTSEQMRALVYWSQGCGYGRIAKILGVSRDAARGRVKRALGTLERLVPIS